MKCFAIVLGIVFVISLFIPFALCDSNPAEQSPNYDNPWTKHGRETATKVVEIENHKYILYDGCYSGGIIHAESCHCKKK